MNKQDKKVILITGSSGGFGRLLCASFLKAGYIVAATLRNMNKKENVLNVLTENNCHENLYFFELDVTDEVQVNKVISDVIKMFGTIDVLINNAGFAHGGYIEEVAMDDWQKQIETNVLGLISVTKSVLPYMREAHSGTIVNMSSISGQIGFPGLGPYSTSKFAIEGFSESLRFEMQPYGIRVFLIEPGSYNTNIWAKGMEAFQINDTSPYKGKSEQLLKMVQDIEKNAGNPRDVVQLILKRVQNTSSTFRHPIGKGVKNTLFLKKIIPWRWIESFVSKKLK